MRQLERNELSTITGGGWRDLGEAISEGIKTAGETGSPRAGWEKFKSIANR